nr:putative ribonuclease H-like domain-containing protein [Tanacetum cinerariifolium]
MTFIEDARTILADSLISIPFWVEAVNTACYVENRVLVSKPHNKTPYELLLGRTPSLRFMRPFGCLVTILKSLDPLEKAREESVQQYVLFPVWSFGSTNPQNTNDDATFGGKKPEFKGEKPESKVHASPSSSAQTKKHDEKTMREAKGKSPVKSLTGYRNLSAEFKDFSDNSINENDEDVGAECCWNKVLLLGVPNLAQRFFKNLQTTRASFVGSASLPPISTSSRQLRDCTNSKVASIAHELKGHIPVRSNQDRSFSYLFFECLKGFNTLFRENEWGIFLEKTSHRLAIFEKSFMKRR